LAGFLPRDDAARHRRISFPRTAFRRPHRTVSLSMAAITDPPQRANWRDLGVRTLSSIILVPAVLLDVWLGDIWFHLLVALLAVMMAHEWTNIVHDRSSAQFALHAAGALCGAFLSQSLGWAATLLVIAVISATSVALAVIQNRKPRLWIVIGVAYVGLPAL